MSTARTQRLRFASPMISVRKKAAHGLRWVLVVCFQLLRELVAFLFKSTDKEKPLLVAPGISTAQLDEIRERLSYYVPSLSSSALEVSSRADCLATMTLRPILVVNKPMPKWMKLRSGTFDIDSHRNPNDGWEWCGLSDYLSSKPRINESSRRFKHHVTELKRKNFKKCYIFGTGTSLEKAIERDWADGYRVVCNTIVRDRDLWRHISPNFIVAGDAIYHFGHTAFARAFRRDLIERLGETQTYFVYPSLFDSIVQREMEGLSDRLIPIPCGTHNRINVDLTKRFMLPGIGNVLPLLLLPLACTLSKDVYLWGFDGRAPNDKLFWKNSKRHSYPELLPELQKAHPRFFEHYVPQSDPSQYVRQVHGDLLDELLQHAEHEGWRFVMMHHSWTPTLEKRCRAE